MPRQGDVVRFAWLMVPAAAMFVGLLACNRGPVAPAPDASDASPCAVYERIDQARLIRLPDGGTFDVHCAEGGTP